MNIAIIGATGKAGRNILQEAVNRGHQVTAIVRDAAKLDYSGNIIEKDIFQLTGEDLQPFDAVVNAFGAPLGREHLHVDAGNVLIAALQGNQHTRLIVVGGAGSLFTDASKKVRLFDSPNFPKEFLPTAKSQGENLAVLEQTQGLNWTFISPSAIFALGRRTGRYTAGSDVLLLNSTGKSYVSYEDFAVAVLDELENPKHQNKRFTVSSEE